MEKKNNVVINNMEVQNLVVCALLSYPNLPVYTKWVYKNYIPGVTIGSTFKQFNGPSQEMRVVEIVPVDTKDVSNLVEGIMMPVEMTEFKPSFELLMNAYNSGNENLRDWSLSFEYDEWDFTLKGDCISELVEKARNSGVSRQLELAHIIGALADTFNTRTKPEDVKTGTIYRIKYNAKTSVFYIDSSDTSFYIPGCPYFYSRKDAEKALKIILENNDTNQLLKEYRNFMIDGIPTL